MNYSKNIFDYARITYAKSNNNKTPKVVSYLPDVLDSHYESGYINRNFVQKVNDDNSIIIEVDDVSCNTIQSTDYYKYVTIRWRLTGTPQEIMDSNKNSIKLVSDKMKNLKLYLPNLLQFAKV
jgi:hypothetical protein